MDTFIWKTTTTMATFTRLGVHNCRLLYFCWKCWCFVVHLHRRIVEKSGSNGL